MGSNPTVLTLELRCGRMVRRLPVKETIAGSIPAAAALRKDKPMGDGSRPENGRAMSLEGSTPSPSAFCALGRAAKAPVFQTGQAGSIPAGHSRGSANGRPAVFEAAREGSTPSPRTLRSAAVSGKVPIPGSSLVFVLVEQPGVLATLSRWRSWVRIPSRTLVARYANRQSGQA